MPRLLRFGQISAGFIAWPWQFDFSEGVNLDATTLLAQGVNVYRHNGPDSFVSAPYTPLFYVLNVPFAWLFGPTLESGRVMSLIATIVIAILLAWCVWKVAGSWAFGALAWVIWLSASPVIVWSALYTQSTLAPALEIAGLAWVLAYPEGRRSYVSIIFFALAFFTKQTAVDAPAAVAIWLMVRDVRQGVRFVAGMAAAILLPLGIGILATKGGLWEHTIGNQILSWRLDRFWKTMDKFWGEYWPLIIGAIVAWVIVVVSMFAGRRGERRNIRQAIAAPLGLVCIYFAVTCVTTLGRLGRDGANYNHLLDLLLPACLLVGSSLGLAYKALGRGMSDSGGRSGIRGQLAVAAFVAAWGLLLAQVFTMNDPVSWYRGTWPSEADDAQMRLISNLIAQTKGDIYSEDAYLLLKNDRKVVYDDAFMFNALSKAGRWDDSVYNKKLSDRSFALILLEHGLGRFTPAGRELFNQNYALLYEDIRDSYVPAGP